MTQTVLHPTPSPATVLREQFRAVGLALRIPILVAWGLLLLATLLAVADLRGAGMAIDFHPDQWLVPGVTGLLLPLLLWPGEESFGAGFLWTLPVDRRRLALARVLAGWGWLMAAVALFVLWLLGLALLSGGSLLPRETILVLPASYAPVPGGIDPAALRTAEWAATPWLWLFPFTGATGAYLLSSALLLGTRHPVRWLAGAALALLAANLVGVAGGLDWLASLPARLLGSLLGGPYGLDALLTGRTESLKVEALLTTGGTVVVWRGLPDPGQSALATALWLAAGAIALGAAASRHRERRRA